VRAWLAALAYGTAAAWPHLVGHAIPLAGLRALGDLHVGVPLLLATLALAVFLSVPAWTTRERMPVCAGAALCLFAVVTYGVGASAALPLVFIGANILRESRHPGPRSSPLWAETLR